MKRANCSRRTIALAISKSGRQRPLWEIRFSVQILGAILAWIPGIFLWVRHRFTSTKAPSITFRVRAPHRPGSSAVYQCKILLDVKNELPGQPVRLAGAYCAFNKNGPLTQHPTSPRDSTTARYHRQLFTPPKNTHD